MKNFMLVLFVMIAMVASNDLQAQAPCTAAQKAACKKICADKTKCTPAEMAACKLVCNKNTASANAVKVVNQSPAKKATCNKATATASTEAAGNGNVQLVGMNITGSGAKKAACSKTCTGKKKE